VDGKGDAVVEQSTGIKIGDVLHFYGKRSVAVLKLLETLRVGETIRIKGKNIEFEQQVKSMQIKHKQIEEAKPGDDIGLKVNQKVTRSCQVFKL